MTIQEHRDKQTIEKGYQSNNSKISKLVDGKKGYIVVNDGEKYTFAFTVTNGVRYNKELAGIDICVDAIYKSSYWGNEKDQKTTIKGIEWVAKPNTWEKRIREQMSEPYKRNRDTTRPDSLDPEYNNKYILYMYGTEYLFINKIDWSKVK